MPSSSDISLVRAAQPLPLVLLLWQQLPNSLADPSFRNLILFCDPPPVVT